jgi:RNA polymerase sigma-B factor
VLAWIKEGTIGVGHQDRQLDVTSGRYVDPMEVLMPEYPSSSPASVEAGLWREFAERRDLRARDELVRIYMPMVRRLAGRYAGVAEPLDDLVQVASIGLVNAINRFDPARGVPFAGFAKPTILGELKRHFRDRVWTVRVPRTLHDAMVRVERATRELSLKLRRPPSVQELADLLGIDPSEVLEALEADRNRRTLSLDAPVVGDDGDDSSPPEWAGEEDRGYGLVEDRALLREVLPGLDPRARLVLELRIADELPQVQIARRLGCSQMQVSRMLHRMLEQLRRQGAEINAAVERAGERIS